MVKVLLVQPITGLLRRMLTVALAAILVFGTGVAVSCGAARPDMASVVGRISKSLVVVEYTAENELHKTRKVSGQGIVLTGSGVVLISGSMLPDELPLSYVHHLIIRIPRGTLRKVPAEFLGRTTDGSFCYIKALKPLNLPPLPVTDGGTPILAEKVFAVGLLSKRLGYSAYIGISRVKAKVTLIHQVCDTQTFGLTCANSPVFDYHTDQLVGITFPSPGTAVELSIAGHSAPVSINDPEQDPLFVTYSDVKAALTTVPSKRFHVQRPWLGVVGLVGMKSALRRLYKVKQAAGVIVGSVIPGMPAAKAGLKSQDIILTIDGKAFSTSPVPDLMLAQFERRIQRIHPGQKIALGILRNGTKALTLPVTIGVMPVLAAQKKHYYNHRLGLVTRNLVFDDTYLRKLPAKQTGVMVVLIKNGAPASLGNTPLMVGYIITKLNDQPVINAVSFQKQLHDAVKKAAGGDLVFVVIKPDGNTAVCRIGLQ